VKFIKEINLSIFEIKIKDLPEVWNSAIIFSEVMKLKVKMSRNCKNSKIKYIYIKT
jgi:hypothetical protein